MPTELTFPGSGGHPLDALLEQPDGPPRAYALFAHRFTGGNDTGAASRISRSLAARGIAVLRLDLTGGDTDLSSRVEDLVRAADHLREHYAAPALLAGHSEGGAAVLAAAHRVPETRAVATIGAPAEPAFASPRTPLLVLHSPRDETVGVDNARQIFEAARHPKSFVALDDADHLLTGPADADYAATVVAAWADRYLPQAPASPDVPEGAVVVAETRMGRYAQRITAGPHPLSADEPRPVGSDTGPSPYGLLLAALGACTSMTLRMYAERKQWPLEQVTVTLQHDRIHARDCAECETESGMLDRIRRQVRLEGPLDDDQRERLLEIADKCPVHRTLTSEVLIQTTGG